MGEGGTAYRRPSCGLVPWHVLAHRFSASRTSRRACPRPVCCGAHCTSVAQTCRAALHVTRQLLPRSPTDIPAPSGQRRCTTYPDTCYKRQAEAVRGGDLDQIARLPRQRTHTCHRRRLSRRKPAAAGGTRASRMNSPRKMQLARSQARPNRPAEAALSASRVGAQLDARLPSDCARVGWLCLRARQARTVVRAAPG